jgi:hypothetical protein
MSGAMNSGRFNPEVNGPVGVRGDSEISNGLLNWESTNLILEREEFSIFDGSFWSGKISIPTAGLAPGQKLKYKFFIENDSGGGWENNIEDREVALTGSLLQGNSDTTLHWVNFDDLALIDNIIEENISLSDHYTLYQNFPNPFNNQTSIRFTLPSAGHVRLNIYSVDGRLVKTLVNQFMGQGSHQTIWSGIDTNGNSLASGLYYMQLKVGAVSLVKKLVLIK